MHADMERRYERVLAELQAHLRRLLPRIAERLPAREVAINTNPFPVSLLFERPGKLVSVDVPAGSLGPVALTERPVAAAGRAVARGP